MKQRIDGLSAPMQSRKTKGFICRRFNDGGDVEEGLFGVENSNGDKTEAMVE